MKKYPGCESHVDLHTKHLHSNEYEFIRNHKERIPVTYLHIEPPLMFRSNKHKDCTEMEKRRCAYRGCSVWIFSVWLIFFLECLHNIINNTEQEGWCLSYKGHVVCPLWITVPPLSKWCTMRVVKLGLHCITVHINYCSTFFCFTNADSDWVLCGWRSRCHHAG